MLAHVDSFLRDECRLNPSDKVLVGVSGGPDSLCLIDILRRLDYQVVGAHLDHGLRPESRAEAETVKRIFARMEVQYVLGQEAVMDYATEHKLSVEEAARVLRYRFLFEQAREANATAVAVGHTADDQVETVLMHLLRGAGMQGLKGMLPRRHHYGEEREISLVRPLLAVWRAEVLDYCQQNGLSPLIDRSNLDKTIYRNRLRLELLPYLETYNPRVRERIWTMSRILAGDLQVLKADAERVWKAVVLEWEPGYVALDRSAFLALLIGQQRRLIRKTLVQFRPGLRDIDHAAIERSIAFIYHPPRTGEMDLLAGLRLVMEEGVVWLVDGETPLPRGGWPQLPENTTQCLDVPGQADLEGGWRVFVEPIDDLEQARRDAETNEDPNIAWVDGASLSSPLVLRGRNPGDRLQPIGMGGKSQKVSDFMVNVRMPRRARDRWPLVVSAGVVVWIPGYRLMHPFRLTDRTKKAFRLRVSREGLGE